jgi:hypothetical protein
MLKEVKKIAAKKGRPTTYNEKLGNKICEAIANSSKGLTHICAENEDFPSRQTIHEWIIKYKDFGDKYTRAKELQAEYLIDEILTISDDGTNDFRAMENSNGIAVDKEHINRSRLRVDTRKWLASKLVPKIYGDKLQAEHTGKDGKAIEHNVNASVTVYIPDNGRD